MCEKNLLCGGLGGGNGDHVDHVVDAAATAQVVDGGGHALHHGTHGLGTGETLDEFVADIAALQVGEHQDVGAAGDVAAGSLAGTHFRHDGGIGLQFAVELDVVKTLLTQ